MKELLRKELKETRKAAFCELSNEKISAGALKLLLEDFKKSGKKPKVCSYVSFGFEADTTSLIKNSFSFCDIYVPIFKKNEPPFAAKLISADKLTADTNGNLPMEAVNLEIRETNFDFVFTPMLGFNDKLYRIGYGQGWYDKFFLSAKGEKIGLAFSSQKIEFTQDSHDIPLDKIITEKGTIIS